MLDTLADAFIPFLPGWLELPEEYAEGLAKGLSHRYVKKVPTGKVSKTGKPRYRYFYHVAHGGTVANHEHFVEGASFRHEGGHWHITAADGDKLTIRHDETGEERPVTRSALGEMMADHHGDALLAHRTKAVADLREGLKNKASVKQLKRLEARAVAAMGGDAKVATAAPQAAPAFTEGAYTSKRGNLKKVAVFTERVGTDEFKRLAAVAKEHGGSYIKDAGGFVFMGDGGFHDFMKVQGTAVETPAPAGVLAPLAAAMAPPPRPAPAPREPRPTRWAPPVSGSKRGNGRMNVADVAKAVREDVKQAIKLGGLPEGIKVSVTIDRFAGGQSLRVKITEAPFQVLNPERLQFDRDHPHSYPTLPLQTEQAKEVERRIEAIVGAYNQDRSDSQSDYFDKDFYQSVDYGHELQSREREAHKAGSAPKASTPVRPTREQAGPKAVAPTDRTAQAAKLRATAAKLQEAADTALGRDRQTNTRRRAGMAANAIEEAERGAKLGQTIGRIAQAIEAGEAPHLAGLANKAQAATLSSIAAQALHRAHLGNYAEYLRQKDVDQEPSLAVHVEMPTGSETVERLRSMGIGNVHQLREAVGEWLMFAKDRSKPASPAGEAAKTKIEESAFQRQNITGFFPTPAPLARRMAQEAGIAPGMTVLEPSAGTGRLADAAKEAGGTVTALEQHHGLSGHLKGKGHNVVGANALDHHEKYDRVVMNPPFENGQDIDHVRHAFDANLKPGGKLVAIMSEGPFFRQDKKAVAFRAWLEEHGGHSEKLPAGTFDESGTGVATRLVTIGRGGSTARESEAASEPARKYGRDDVDYPTWYSAWSQQLAKTHTRAELERRAGVADSAAAKAAGAHHRAVSATTSMGGQSQRRAHARNTTAAAGDEKIAISGALEIHDLFPEHAKGSAPAEPDPVVAPRAGSHAGAITGAVMKGSALSPLADALGSIPWA